MVDATKDESMLPEELLENAFGVVRAVQKNRIWIPSWPAGRLILIVRPTGVHS